MELNDAQRAQFNIQKTQQFDDPSKKELLSQAGSDPERDGGRRAKRVRLE